MKLNAFFLYFLLLILSFFTGGCADQGKSCKFSLTRTWTVEHLDNSGASPELSTQDIPRNVYGLRISNIGASAPGDCDSYYIYGYFFRSIEIITLRPLNDYPAGADVSSEFLVRTHTRPARYATVEEALNELNMPEEAGPTLTVDFILRNTPKSPDSCQFEIRLLSINATSDSGSYDPVTGGSTAHTDTISFTLKSTPVFLK